MSKGLIEKIKITPDSEDEKTKMLFEKIGDIKIQGFVTKEQGIQILKWKSPRPLRHYEINSDKDFREISKLAFESKEEKVRMHILTALNGVNYPAR